MKCLLCPHACIIAEGKTGLCGVRKNERGQIFLLNYGQISALALDPVEKKPLKKFKSGTMVLSAGSWGCNLCCAFCQNWQIAKERPMTKSITVRQLVTRAMQSKSHGNIGLAYTYNEPLVAYEFVRDCAVLAKEEGLANILVSNGYINEEPLRELAPLLDAANIDVKSFNEKFYQEVCGGSLTPVKRTVEILAEHCHLEVTTLVIPGLNDSFEEIAAIAEWLSAINKNIAYHLTRYFPCYKMNNPPTAREKLFALQEVAAKFLTNVYVGNM